MRYAFYISGRSGRLFKFLKQANMEFIKKEIKLVISDAQIDEKLQVILTKCGISAEIIEDKKLEGDRKKKNRLISDFMLKKLIVYEIDYCISFGSHILSGDLLKKYKNKLINFHPAILPMFPGIKSIDQAVDHGNVLLVGNTAHFIDSGMDTGMVIMQSVIPLKAFRNTRDYDIVLDLQIEMLNKLLKVLDEGRLQIINGVPTINGADYMKSVIFPYF